MVKCRFIRQFQSGSCSDTFNDAISVDAVPRVGEQIKIYRDGTNPPTYEVKSVIHKMDPDRGAQEVVVYYGE